MGVTVAFDVDGCLLSPSDSRRPIEDVRTLMVLLHRMGCKIVLWSGSGQMHAIHAAREAGVTHVVDRYASKTETDVQPDVTIDDQAVTLGRVNIRIP